MKRHVSGRPHDVRTRPLSLILADAKNSLLGRFFLYPTKAMLLWEPYGTTFRNVDFPGLPQRQNTPYLARFS